MTPPIPDLPGVSHRYVQLGDLRVHVAEAGAGAPLVLLHGWPNHWYVWRHVVPHLAGEFRLIMPDMRGFGWTDAPRSGYAKEQLRDDLLGLLDALGLDQVGLVGHDWGGWVGFLACLHAPHRFEGFIGLNISHPNPQPTLENLATLRRFAYQLVLSAPVAGRNVVRHTDFVRTIIRVATRARRAEAADLFADHLREPARARASSQLYRTFVTRELPAILAGRYRHQRLTVPTRVWLGARDPAIRPSLLAGHEDFADDFAFEVLDDIGHFLPEEAPEVVVDAIRRFFA